jgi:chromosome segregation ATPase
VRLELRQGTNRPTLYEVAEVGFLIGTVPGCDLRLPGADLPPVLCLIARHTNGAILRKLVPTLPILVNGKPVSSGVLAHGDRVTLGAVELLVQAAGIETAERRLAPVPGQREQELDERVRQLDARQRQLEEQTRELEADRVIWYQRRQEMEQEYQQRSAATVTAEQLAEREQALDQRRDELDRQQQELADLRQQLYDRYRERRDRLAGLHEAVNRAARKVQERKQQLDAETQQRAAQREQDTVRQAALDEQVAAVAQARQRVAEQTEQLLDRQQQLERELAEQKADYQAREQQLAQDREALEKNQAQYQADLVRLDRLQAALEQRQQQLDQQARQLEQHDEQLQRQRRQLEEQAIQLGDRQAELQAEADRLAKEKAEQEAAGAPLAQRAAALDGQQAMLTALRTRLERMREEQRREGQQLADQRAQLEAGEADLRQRVQDFQALRAELDNEKQLREQERRQFDERRAVLETAVSQLRQLQEKLAGEEERLRLRVLALNAAADEHAEEASLLRARSAQVLELQQRLAADRQALRERETTLVQGEQVREALQEQLRRRSEDLTARQRAVAEQARLLAEERTAVETRQAEVDRARHQAEEEFTALRGQIEGRAAELDRLQGELADREDRVRQQTERLKEAGRKVGEARKTLWQERTAWEAAQREAGEAAARTRAEAESARQELAGLLQQLPELELRGQAAAGRLAQARDQLREHLAELHAYARQSHEDLEAVRAQVQSEAEGVRQRELALHRARDEHRLAVAAFRQQLIEWQGQVADMKRSLAQDETRLERRQAQVAEQARQVDATSARLSEQAERIQEQERAVTENRQEMERHLNDMREWYRRKLRELSERRQVESARPDDHGSGEKGGPLPGSSPDILSLNEDLDPGDHKLGELLRARELVDADTLTALLVEARKQRRSLRQALLAGGYLTLYQMALIEAGNLDGLVLGPVHVIDRLRTTPREAVYRVFDPRRGQEAVLRHLAEAEMLDAVHPDEFRQRFAQAAALQHPHLAGTLEVLEIAGRPAALQEWLSGLPGTDWPALVAVPGVWYRLLSQAALGLHAAHEAGLVHGHLRPGLAVLTSDGILKWCGFGEPPWLVMPPVPDALAGDVAADLAALGRIAAAWAAPEARRKGAKIKPLPAELRAVLDRLTAEAADARYPSAAALLEDLDRAGADVSANAEAWERLVRYVREHTAEDVVLRRSA